MTVFGARPREDEQNQESHQRIPGAQEINKGNCD
jgi:hypothetical protein